MGKELNFWNNFELRIYYLLGVQQFRKVILWLEKVKHHRDNSRNENYHLSKFDLISIERYTGFLIYNAFLHCIMPRHPLLIQKPLAICEVFLSCGRETPLLLNHKLIA